MIRFCAALPLVALLFLSGCMANGATPGGPHDGVDGTNPSGGLVPGQTQDN